MVVAMLITIYMLFDPSPWVIKLMQLTDMSTSFRVFLLILGIGSFALSYASERYVFPRLAKLIGSAKDRLRKGGRAAKQRKQYKIVLDTMQI